MTAFSQRQHVLPVSICCETPGPLKPSLLRQPKTQVLNEKKQQQKSKNKQTQDRQTDRQRDRQTIAPKKVWTQPPTKPLDVHPRNKRTEQLTAAELAHSSDVDTRLEDVSVLDFPSGALLDVHLHVLLPRVEGCAGRALEVVPDRAPGEVVVLVDGDVVPAVEAVADHISVPKIERDRERDRQRHNHKPYNNTYLLSNENHEQDGERGEGLNSRLPHLF